MIARYGRGGGTRGKGDLKTTTSPPSSSLVSFSDALNKPSQYTTEAEKAREGVHPVH